MFPTSRSDDTGDEYGSAGTKALGRRRGSTSRASLDIRARKVSNPIATLHSKGVMFRLLLALAWRIDDTAVTHPYTL